jgi:hypothetical protein
MEWRDIDGCLQFVLCNNGRDVDEKKIGGG